MPSSKVNVLAVKTRADGMSHANVNELFNLDSVVFLVKSMEAEWYWYYKWIRVKIDPCLALIAILRYKKRLLHSVQDFK